MDATDGAAAASDLLPLLLGAAAGMGRDPGFAVARRPAPQCKLHRDAITPWLQRLDLARTAPILLQAGQTAVAAGRPVAPCAPGRRETLPDCPPPAFCDCRSPSCRTATSGAPACTGDTSKPGRAARAKMEAPHRQHRSGAGQAAQPQARRTPLGTPSCPGPGRPSQSAGTASSPMSNGYRASQLTTDMPPAAGFATTIIKTAIPRHPAITMSMSA